MPKSQFLSQAEMGMFLIHERPNWPTAKWLAKLQNEGCIYYTVSFS